MEYFKSDKILFLSLLIFFGSCAVENINPNEAKDEDVLDLTSYSNPAMNGNWRMLNNGLYNLYIDGNAVKFCNTDGNGEDNGYLSQENMIYIFSEDTIYVPYTFDGETLNTVAGRPSSNFFNPDSRTDWMIDSDYNSCLGNVNGSSFNFSFKECPPYKYKVYINDEFLFDETTWQSGCEYLITPSLDYTINVYVQYTYCPHPECAFSPGDFITTSYRKTLQLKQLRNYNCNNLRWSGGTNSSNLRISQVL